MRTLGSLDHGRQNNFDVIRFTAATMVIFAHSFALLKQIDPLGRLTGFIDCGALAVDIFFVISGYLITKSLMRRPLIEYVQARMLRLFPGWAVAVLFCALIVGPVASLLPLHTYLSNSGVQTFLFNEVNNIISSHYVDPMLPGVFKSNPYPHVNGALWTLYWEVWCYIRFFFIGLIGFLFHKMIPIDRFIRATISVLFVYYFIRIALFEGNGFESFDSLRFISNFLTGAIAYVYRDKIRLYPALAVGLLIACVFAYHHAVFLPLFRLALGYTILVVAFHPLVRLNNFGKYGDFSYGIYIYAFPIQQVIISHHPGITPMQLCLSAFAVTLPVAVLSWRLIEKPALGLKEKLIFARNRLTSQSLPQHQ